MSKVLPHIIWILAIIIFTYFYHQNVGDKAAEENEKRKKDAAEKMKRRRDWKKANGIEEWESVSEEVYKKFGL